MTRVYRLLPLSAEQLARAGITGLNAQAMIALRWTGLELARWRKTVVRTRYWPWRQMLESELRRKAAEVSTYLERPE